MRVLVYIVICIVVILEMVVEANAIRGVHAEYIRRRWGQGQSAPHNRYYEVPVGVHAEYIRRRRIESQTAHVKIHPELHTIQHRRQPPPLVRQHLRHRNGGNTHI